ncbi:MAG: ATP-dependent Clp protease ATP-binding subunit ClpX, partial [Phycisphaerales bacterium JB064]
EGAKLQFTKAALKEIAQRALKRDTGARALRGVMEDIMLDLLYELPEHNHDGDKYVIDVDDLKGKLRLDDLRVESKKTA